MNFLCLILFLFYKVYKYMILYIWLKILKRVKFYFEWKVLFISWKIVVVDIKIGGVWLIFIFIRKCIMENMYYCRFIK